MSNNFQYPRWSEWRKWDLHVHTPASNWYTWTWDQFKDQLKASDCAVIWINDYNSVAWYKELRTQIDTWLLDIGNKVLLPVVEMRMSDSLQHRLNTTNWATHFNFHIIFSDKINVDDIETFIKSLDAGGTMIWSDYNDKQKIQEKKVSFATVLKALRGDPKFEDKFLIWLPYDEYGGIWDIDPNSDVWIKQKFIKDSDFLGSSNANQIDFFLWKSLKPDGTPKFLEEDFKTWFWSKKACIKWSDSHSHTYPIGKLKDEHSQPIEKYCWIKADPSFEGLKQVSYEPEDRIKIWEVKPEEKKDYQVINKVQFIDDSFTPKEILINQNLTTIIGWRSTGKSILLRNIAQTIDENEVSERLTDIPSWRYSKEIGNFKVFWCDGVENSKDNSHEIRKIIYIPQSYLNRLIDKKEDKDSIEDIIQSILNQEDDIKKVFDILESSKREIEKKISNKIDDLFFKEEDLRSLIEIIKKTWDKKWIEAEIEKLKKEISELKEKAWIDKQDIENYNSLNSKIELLNKEKKDNERDIKILQKLKENTGFWNIEFITPETLLDGAFEEYIIWLSKGVLISLESEVEEIRIEVNKRWIKKVDDELQRITKLKETTEKNLLQSQTEIKPLLDKVAKSKALEDKIKRLKQEEMTLKDISILEESLQKKKDAYYLTINELLNLHSKFYDILFEAKWKILAQKSIHGDLEFNMDLIPRNSAFTQEFIEDICNLTKLTSFEEWMLAWYVIETPVSFKQGLEKIIYWIIRGKLELKKSYSKKEALTRLLKSWFTFDYKIRQWDDEISEMSPWKKSFVLLKLLIELDNSKCPILLDQPEDDLDNRSIYNDLVKFIKSKKKDRQIIIATHNPNLVVWSDAECIIVANQAWENSKNETYHFEYVQWALENAFILDWEDKTLYKQWIQEHVCDVLEWGKIAFEQRKKKYNISFS